MNNQALYFISLQSVSGLDRNTIASGQLADDDYYNNVFMEDARQKMITGQSLNYRRFVRRMLRSSRMIRGEPFDGDAADETQLKNMLTLRPKRSFYLWCRARVVAWLCLQHLQYRLHYKYIISTHYKCMWTSGPPTLPGYAEYRI